MNRLVVLSCFLVACEPAADLWETEASLAGPDFTLGSLERQEFAIDLELSDLPSGSLPFTGTITTTFVFQGDDIDLYELRSVKLEMYNFHGVQQNLLAEKEIQLDPSTEHEVALTGEVEILCDADPCTHGVDVTAELIGVDSLGVTWTIDATVIRSQSEEKEGVLALSVECTNCD